MAGKAVEGAYVDAVSVTIPSSITGKKDAEGNPIDDVYEGLGNVYGGGLGTTAEVQGTTHLQIGAACP